MIGVIYKFLFTSAHATKNRNHLHIGGQSFKTYQGYTLPKLLPKRIYRKIY